MGWGILWGCICVFTRFFWDTYLFIIFVNDSMEIEEISCESTTAWKLVLLQELFNYIVPWLFLYLFTLTNSMYSKYLDFKGGFFQKVRFVFQISKSPKKNYSKSLSWTWNLKFEIPAHNSKQLFQISAQDSDLE